jgi:hypothetical protein
MEKKQQQKFLVSKFFPDFVKHNKEFVSSQFYNSWIRVDELNDIQRTVALFV